MANLWSKLKRSVNPGGASRHAVSEELLGQVQRLIDAGHVLEDRGEFEAALGNYRAAVQMDPNFPRAHMNVGNALRKLGRWDEAIAAQRSAVACDPAFAQARFNLGLLLAEHGEWSSAERELLQALQLEPRMTQARITLADAYERNQRFDEAERQYRKARESDPAHAGMMLNFATFLVRQGQIEEALECLRACKRLDPEIKGVDSQMLFAMNFRADLSAAEIAEEHFRIGQLLTLAAGPKIDEWPNTIDEARPLRIGYVSGDFGPHPVALFIRPILWRHDRSRFEVYCYSNASESDSVTQSLRELTDHWRDIALLADDQVIELIRRDRIDILVDLAGHTNRERLSVFARHPAPIQVTWLGYLNTTGLPAMGYRITDANTDPAGSTEGLHTEQLMRMPDSQWCYFAWHDIDRISRPHAERPDALVFGSFNQYVKLTDSCLALWGRVLARVPRSELVVLDVRQEHMRTALLSRLRHHGVDERRVTLHGRKSIGEYFAAVGNVDIALDTIPYNGATTTLDALWMGVPLIALKGDRGISRGSYSILRTLGLDELIAHTADEYVELNSKLALDAAWRRSLRETLRDRLGSSPLMDAQGFTASLETRYREMWRNWCSQQSRNPPSN